MNLFLYKIFRLEKKVSACVEGTGSCIDTHSARKYPPEINARYRKDGSNEDYF